MRDVRRHGLYRVFVAGRSAAQHHALFAVTTPFKAGVDAEIEQGRRPRRRP